MVCEDVNVKRIPLMNYGEMAGEAIVDAADYEWLSQWEWRIQRNRNSRTAYARRSELDQRKTVNVLMHRVILNAHKGVNVDHANGNGLDNRRCNLRLATQSQNRCNSRMSIRNKSGYKGVVPDKRRWRAQAGINGCAKYLGNFDTPEEAARAYDEFAVTHYGEFARTNFPR